MMANTLIILTIGLLCRIFPMVNIGDHDLHLSRYMILHHSDLNVLFGLIGLIIPYRKYDTYLTGKNSNFPICTSGPQWSVDTNCKMRLWCKRVSMNQL